MKSVIVFFLHLPVWIVVLFIAVAMSSEVNHFNNTLFTVLQSFALITWLLSGFYLFYGFLIPQFLAKKKTQLFLFWATMSVLVALPALIFLLDKLSFAVSGIDDPSKAESVSSGWLYPWFGGTLGSAFCGTLGSFYRFGTDWFWNAQKRSELEKRNLESELRLFRSRLNPHLLFNTLNNIDSLIHNAPEKASEMLSKLATLLRHSVYDAGNNSIRMKDELDFISMYIDLEKIRLKFPENVRFDADCNPEIEIPSMIFLPYIENSFKHSNLNKQSERINIAIRQENNTIMFVCSNTISSQNLSIVKGGAGMELAEKRIQMLYPQKHELKIYQEKGVFTVKLKIDIS